MTTHVDEACPPVRVRSRQGQGACRSLLMGAAIAAFIGSPALAQTHYEATITRTTFGVPHVQADDFGGLGYGAAYAQAQDNICLMADAYLSAAGERTRFLGLEAATAVGLAPTTNLNSDVYHRVMLNVADLRAGLAEESLAYRDIVDGWVAGYNRFLKDHARRLPAECADAAWVRPITRDDVLRNVASFAMLSSSAFYAANLAAEPDGPAAMPATAPPPALPDEVKPSAQGQLGSNGWAFGGDATSNGRGLVVGNPHFPWQGPNRFYQVHLTIPGVIDVAGAAITNQPWVAIGFNQDVAWSHTVDTAAHMTLFELTLDPADPTTYMIDGRREPMVRRDIVVPNRDGAPIVRSVYESRHGPIISIPGTEFGWSSSRAFALQDANRGNIRIGDVWLDIARSKTVADVQTALSDHQGAPFVNTLAADRHGDALYADITAAANVSADRFAACGAIAGRAAARLQRTYILDGDRTECLWEISPESPVAGLLPAAQMAAIHRRDFVQNSNDSYRWTNPAAGVSDLGPMMGVDLGESPNLRTRSGLQEIQTVLARDKFDLELALATMFGNKNFAAQLALPQVLALCRTQGTPEAACSTLAAWDGQANVGSRGSMLFSLFWAKASARVDLWRTPFDPGDPVGTPHTLKVEGAAGVALMEDLAWAAERMTSQGLALDAPLGSIQFAQRGEERIPVSGDMSGAVLNYTYGAPVSGGFNVIHGASYVQAVTFNEEGPVAKALLTFSQSTNPASPHYADQTRAFSTLSFADYPFSASAIRASRIGRPLRLRE